MDQNQFVVFFLGKEEYALDILKVNEINRLKEIEISQIPKAPDFIEGMINLRGVPIPVINIRKKFGMGFCEITKKSRIIVVNNDRKVIGLLVDGVACVETFDEGCLISSPDEIKEQYHYIEQVIKKEKRMIFCLDIEKVLYEEEDRM